MSNQAPVRSRGLREKIVVAANPMPKTTETELYKIAGFETRQPAGDHMDPFALEWQYGSRGTGELVVLKAGETIQLRESEAAEFHSRFKDEGGVIYPADATPGQVKQALLGGLKKALKFYDDSGLKRVIEFRKVHGYGKEDVLDYKENLLWAYYFNDARVQVIKSLIAEMERGKPSAADDKL